MMLARWGKRRRGAAIVLAAGLAAVLVAVARARPLDFLHIRSNLSQTATLVSAYPDLAVSPDGNWVVAAWTEGYDDHAGYQGHVYLRAASETGSGWGSKTLVCFGSGSAFAYDAAVAVTGTTAHVAYVVGGPTLTYVRYKKCYLSLPQIQCDVSADVVASVDARFSTITWVDLALDAGGNPHVVWAQAGEEGGIRYRAFNGDRWGSAEDVAPGEVNNRPAVACADGYVHVVWEEETQHQIWYRRRIASGWEPSAVELCAPQTTRPPRNPDVAAGGGRVFVVWDWCSDEGTTSPCLEYNLVYRRSNDSGAHWGSAIREVGTDVQYGLDGLTDYDSAGWYEPPYGPDVRADYLQYLRPSIALNDDGWPAVVWHAEAPGASQDTDYAVYYSYAIMGTPDSVAWETDLHSVLSRGTLGSAVVALGQAGGEQHLHVAYMRKLSSNAWDVFYDSNERDRYAYSYLPLILNAD